MTKTHPPPLTPWQAIASLRVLTHPLIAHKLTHMRDVRTSTKTFRQLLREITLLMGYEITRDLPTVLEEIATPLASMRAPVIAGKKVAVVAVLRAGLGMVEGLMDLIPGAKQGHIGLYRGADHRPVEYYVRLPDVQGRDFILCDPMLATGNSAVHAVDVLLRHGVVAEKMKFLALVAAPQGIQTLAQAHPTVPIYVAAVDQCLNEKAYIVPGLGDAGDRIFGTPH